MRFSHESLLLRPRDPSLANSDDWPIFSLSHVDIYSQDSTNGIANLLHADATNALTIRGKLEGLSKELSGLRLRPSAQRTEPIEITEVKQYAYGQYADGSVDIWAAGQAGWYAIKPSRAYKRTYQDMIEGIQMLYFVADAYTAPESKTVRKGEADNGDRKEVGAQAVFEKWAKEHKECEGDWEKAADRFYEHKYFLLVSMLAGKEGIAWSRNPFFRHLEHTFPDETEHLRRKRGDKPARNRKSATPKPEAGGKRKRDSPASSNAPPRARRKSTDIESIASKTNTTPIYGSIHPDPEGSVKSRRGRGRPKKHNDEASETNSVSTPVTRPMLDGTNDESDEPMSEPQARGGKGKSILRPKTSKYVPEHNEETIDLNEPDAIPVVLPPTPSRDSSAKRKGQENLTTSRPKKHGGRRASSNIGQAVAGADDVDEGIDMSLDQGQDIKDAEMSDVDSSELEGMALPFRLSKDDLAGNGEGDTWTCPLDGCMHRIYAASEPASQNLIKEHYRTHVDDEDTGRRLQLVKRMEAPGLPVNRLLDRIQKISGQRGFPPPILSQY